MLQAEEAGEVVPVGEAGGQRDFSDGQVCGSQQIFRMGQAQILQIPLRGHAEFPAEELQQIIRRDVQRAGNAGEFQLRIVKFSVHQSLGLKENRVLSLSGTALRRDGLFKGEGEDAPQNGLTPGGGGESFHRLHEKFPQSGEHGFPLFLFEQQMEGKFREAFRRRGGGNQLLVQQFRGVGKHVRHIQSLLCQTLAEPVDMEAPAFHPLPGIGIVQQARRNENQGTGVAIETSLFSRHPSAAAAYIDQFIVIEPPVFFNPSGRPLPVPVHQTLRMERFQCGKVSICPVNNRFILYAIRFYCGII